MISNTRYAGPSEPSKAKVVSQSIDTDEMSRHQLIDHVQLNKVKFIKQTVGVCHSSVLRNGAIKRKWRRIDKPNERLWGRHKRVVLLLREGSPT